MQHTIICDKRTKEYFFVHTVTQSIGGPKLLLFKLSFEAADCYLEETTTEFLLLDQREKFDIVLFAESFTNLAVFLGRYGIAMRSDKISNNDSSRNFISMLNRKKTLLTVKS